MPLIILTISVKFYENLIKVLEEHVVRVANSGRPINWLTDMMTPRNSLLNFQWTTLSTVFCLSSSKGSTLKGKNLLLPWCAGKQTISYKNCLPCNKCKKKKNYQVYHVTLSSVWMHHAQPSPAQPSPAQPSPINFTVCLKNKGIL